MHLSIHKCGLLVSLNDSIHFYFSSHSRRKRSSKRIHLHHHINQMFIGNAKSLINKITADNCLAFIFLISCFFVSFCFVLSFGYFVSNTNALVREGNAKHVVIEFWKCGDLETCRTCEIEYLLDCTVCCCSELDRLPVQQHWNFAVLELPSITNAHAIQFNRVALSNILWLKCLIWFFFHCLSNYQIRFEDLSLDYEKHFWK